MYFKAAILFSLAASAIALPTSQDAPKKRAGVLSVQNYADFQVSDGTAGNALAEVQAKFPVSSCHPIHASYRCILPLFLISNVILADRRE